MRHFSPARAISLSAVLPLMLATGCSQTAAHGNRAANAPALNEESQQYRRGVSDPNAPFVLVDRSGTSSATTAPSAADGAAIACEATTLRMSEVAANMKGNHRVLTLAFRNVGSSTCRLSGYPVIGLQNGNGSAIADIKVKQTGSLSLIGSVEPQMQGAISPVDVVLPPAAEATFQVGWVSGEGCAVVSRFTVEIPNMRAQANGQRPETAQSFALSRPLNVCNGEVRTTALVAANGLT